MEILGGLGRVGWSTSAASYDLEQTHKVSDTEERRKNQIRDVLNRTVRHSKRAT